MKDESDLQPKALDFLKSQKQSVNKSTKFDIFFIKSELENKTLHLKLSKNGVAVS